MQCYGPLNSLVHDNINSAYWHGSTTMQWRKPDEYRQSVRPSGKTAILACRSEAFGFFLRSTITCLLAIMLCLQCEHVRVLACSTAHQVSKQLAGTEALMSRALLVQDDDLRHDAAPNYVRFMRQAFRTRNSHKLLTYDSVALHFRFTLRIRRSFADVSWSYYFRACSIRKVYINVRPFGATFLYHFWEGFFRSCFRAAPTADQVLQQCR